MFNKFLMMCVCCRLTEYCSRAREPPHNGHHELMTKDVEVSCAREHTKNAEMIVQNTVYIEIFEVKYFVGSTFNFKNF